MKHTIPIDSFTMNYSILDNDAANNVRNAINSNEAFYGYIPENGMQFIVENYETLASIGHLEKNWIQAYLKSNNLNNIPLEILKKIFDACDREQLQKLYPIPDATNSSKTECWNLFRGCAGINHRMGMSWTTSMSKALWYAAWHKVHNNLNNCAVYATIAEKKDIYCYLDDNEPEFILHPRTWWKIDIPETEFRIDRPR